MDRYEDDNIILDIDDLGDEDLEWDLEDADDLDAVESAAWEDGALALVEQTHEHVASAPVAKQDLPEASEPDEPEPEEAELDESEPVESESVESAFEEIEILDNGEPAIEQTESQPTEEQLATGVILVDDNDLAQAAFTEEAEAHAGHDQDSGERDDEESAPRRHSFLDIAIVLAGAAVVVLAALTYTQYSHMQAVEVEAAQFASLGSNLVGAGVIGEDQIAAIASHRKAADAARAEQEEIVAERQLLAENEGSAPVTMTLSSIQSDLKVKFRSESGYLISNVPFRISVTAPNGTAKEYEDDDRDGVIHLTSISSGTYQVTMEPLVEDTLLDTDVAETEAYRLYSKYQIPTDTQSVEVTDKIAYEVVDVSDEIKSASEVNVAAEDTQHKMATESALQDTVEWVASSETTTTTTKTVEASESASTTSSEASTAATTESAETASSAASTEAAEAASTEASTESSEAASTASSETSAEVSSEASTESAETATTEASSSSSEGDTAASNEIPKEATEVTNSGTSESTETASTGMPAEAVEVTTTKYTGWQNIDGKTYYYNANGEPVTGSQVINGAPYTFDANGVLQSGSSQIGIDVSVWNGSIDWSQVANSGVSYAVIRCGYRGSSSGALIRDSSFSTNIAGATAAGLKVGIYVFSQAINEIEAVEEASMAIELASGYNVRLPIFIDVEAAGGRADGLSMSERTAVVSAFCQTVQAAGYSAGIYSNTNWLTEKVNTSSLTNYHIWVAQYASALQYTRTRYDIWQYSCKGHVAGISGDVDMNMAYRSY